MKNTVIVMKGLARFGPAAGSWRPGAVERAPHKVPGADHPLMRRTRNGEVSKRIGA